MAINQLLIPYLTRPGAQTQIGKEREAVGPRAFADSLKSASVG